MTPSQDELDRSWGYIYRITCLLDGTQYIGKHRHTPGEPWDTYFGSGKRITEAISRFGRKNFVKELVEYCDSWNVAALEAHHIRLLEASGTPFYNLHGVGGEARHVWAHDEWIYLCHSCGIATVSTTVYSGHMFALCRDCTPSRWFGPVGRLRRLKAHQFTEEALDLASIYATDPGLRRAARQAESDRTAAMSALAAS